MGKLAISGWTLVKGHGKNKLHQITPNIGTYSRHGKQCIFDIFTACRNAEDGPKGKQGGVIYFFHGPKVFGVKCMR